jgi:DNA-binding MarR family transcriptional regulator
MVDATRKHLANLMVSSLPKFGHWATSIRDFETPFGRIGYRQLELLWALRYNLIDGGPVTPSAIAAHFEVQPSVVTRILVKLEAHGFVSRITDPLDGRSASIQITPLGIELSAYVEDLYDQEMLASLASLDDTQIEELCRNVEILNRIATNLLDNRRNRFDAGS